MIYLEPLWFPDELVSATGSINYFYFGDSAFLTLN